jgi:hypothetical protein
MKYLLLTYMNEKAWLALPADEQKRMMDACGPHVEKLKDTGKLLAGAPLHPTSTATTVRVQNHKRILTDGPFAETREQLGGYTIIDAKDLDEAIAIASGFVPTDAPDAMQLACIEVRPILELEGSNPVPLER